MENKRYAKHDKLKKTGPPGGKEVLLDEAESFIVHEIVGRNSHVTLGLNIGESGRPRPRANIETEDPGFNEERDVDESVFDDDVVIQSTSRIDNSERYLPSEKPLKRRRTSAKEEENDKTQQRRKELQAEVLEVQLYKHKLECLELERELQISTSKFTENLISSENFEVSFQYD